MDTRPVISIKRKRGTPGAQTGGSRHHGAEMTYGADDDRNDGSVGCSPKQTIDHVTVASYHVTV